MTFSKPPTQSNPACICTACGYNLAGLELPGKCPECGAENTGLRPFVRPNPPPPPPRWFCILRTAWFAAAFGTPAVAIVLALSRKRAGNTMLPEEAGRVLMLVGFAGIVVILAAAWLRQWNTLIAVLVIIFVAWLLKPALGTA